MLIMGIDPGIAISGYGFLKKNDIDIEVLEYGVLTTDAKDTVPERLKHIFKGYTELMTRYKPSAVAIEELFFNKNAKTIINVGQARGIAILAAALLDIDVFEYTPLQVKQSVVGYGRADKIQVQDMIRLILKLRERPRPDDAADALAVALCHIHSNKLQNIIYKKQGFKSC